jgi:hypothetical protein
MRTTLTTIIYSLLFGLLFSFPVYSQTVVNDYNEVTVIGGTTATVTSLTGINGIHTLAIGDTVLIIQMQGATIDESNSASFGTATLNNSGKYELNVICGITGNTVAFKLSLVNSYTAPTGKVQIVTHQDGKLLTYTVPAGGVTGTPWNGTVGGVVFIKANAVTLNGPVTANGIGFRGGAVGGIVGAPGTVCDKNVLTATGTFLYNNSGCNGASQTTGVTDYYYPKLKMDIPTATGHLSPPSPATLDLTQYMGGWKGEGIAAYITDKETGRGRQANGGGGGQTHNSGGAGGGLYAAGGVGGRQWDIATPAALVNGGIGGTIGGAPNSLKLFMGGGGGGGHGNYPNGHPSPGANGGGIVLFRSVTFTFAANRTISADGLGNLGAIDNDSEGGGGSGGSIYFDVKSMTGGASVLTVSSKGGRGGDGINGGDCIGTGGGGAGGYILSKVTFPASTVKTLTGGISGVVTGVTNTGKPCYGVGPDKWGSTDGAAGSFLDGQAAYSIPMGSPISCSLPIEIASLSTVAYTDKVCVLWSTASEKNNQYFVIERSKDGIHFEETGTVNGAGNSARLLNYSFCDKDPHEGLSYYRLKQVDFDGQYAYSVLKSADLHSAYGITGIYPQPLSNDKLLFINYLLPANDKVSLKLTDALGKELSNHSENSLKGFNHSQLSLNHLPVGIYYLIFQTGELVQCRKVVVE